MLDTTTDINSMTNVFNSNSSTNFSSTFFEWDMDTVFQEICFLTLRRPFHKHVVCLDTSFFDIKSISSYIIFVICTG